MIGKLFRKAIWTTLLREERGRDGEGISATKDTKGTKGEGRRARGTREEGIYKNGSNAATRTWMAWRGKESTLKSVKTASRTWKSGNKKDKSGGTKRPNKSALRTSSAVFLRFWKVGGKRQLGQPKTTFSGGAAQPGGACFGGDGANGMREEGKRLTGQRGTNDAGERWEKRSTRMSRMPLRGLEWLGGGRNLYRKAGKLRRNY